MKKRLFYFLKSYLGFTKRESNGFLMLLPVVFFAVLLPEFYDVYLKKTAQKDYDKYLEKVVKKIEEDGGAAVVSVSSGVSVSGMDTSVWEGSKKEPVLVRKVDFSEADSVLLQIVPGVGEILAGRIVKYRENLGGLYRKDQLLEVYGLKEEVAKRIFEYFTFKPEITSRLPINSASVKELAKHPYISYGEAKVIVAYREQHGHYGASEDLLGIKIFTEDWLDRVKPYLILE